MVFAAALVEERGELRKELFAVSDCLCAMGVICTSSLLKCPFDISAGHKLRLVGMWEHLCRVEIHDPTYVGHFCS